MATEPTKRSAGRSEERPDIRRDGPSASQQASGRPLGRRPFRLGITGAGGLQAQELASLVPGSALAQGGPAMVHYFSPAGEGSAAQRLATMGGEAVVLEPLTAGGLEGLDAVFFTADEAETRLWAPRAAAAGAVALDLTSALAPGSEGREVRVPHPAAQALAAVLPALAALGAGWRAATIFEPASERGLAGVEELRDQSLRLLSAQAAPKKVYGGQVAFNLRAALSPQVRPSLGELAAVVAADLGALAVAGGFTPPAIHVLQAPIFHAHVISLFAAWEKPMSEEQVTAALRGVPAEFRASQPDALSAAGESGIQVGAPLRDPLHPGAFWIALSVDNLRLRAAAALHLAGRLLGRI